MKKIPVQRLAHRGAAARLVAAAVLLCAGGCGAQQKGTLEFFRLKEAALEVRRPVETETLRSEKTDYVVVANLGTLGPTERAAMLRFWNDSLDHAGIERDFSRYTLWFLRETGATPRDYKPSENGYTGYDRIDDHTEDLVATISWQRCGLTTEKGVWHFRSTGHPTGAADTTLRGDCAVSP